MFVEVAGGGGAGYVSRAMGKCARSSHRRWRGQEGGKEGGSERMGARREGEKEWGHGTAQEGQYVMASVWGIDRQAGKAVSL